MYDRRQAMWFMALFAADIHGEFSGPVHQAANNGRNTAHQRHLQGKSRTSSFCRLPACIPLDKL